MSFLMLETSGAYYWTCEKTVVQRLSTSHTIMRRNPLRRAAAEADACLVHSLEEGMFCTSSAAPGTQQMVQWYTAGLVTTRQQHIERLTRKIIVKQGYSSAPS